MNNTPVWHFLRIMLISGGIFISILVLFLIILGWKYQSSIQELFTERLQKQLHVDFQVADIKLDFVRSFPLASVTFSDVMIQGAAHEQRNDLQIHTESIKLQFNILNILKKKLIITQLTVNKGLLTINTDGDIALNSIFNTTKETNPNTIIQFDIRRILVNDFELFFSNNSLKEHTNLKISKARVTGNLTESGYYFSAKGILDASEFEYKEIRLPNSRHIEFDINMNASANGIFQATDSKLKWEDQNIIINGIFQMQGGSFFANASVNAQHLDITRLIPIIPGENQKKILVFQPKGKLNIEATVNYNPKKSTTPHIYSAFDLRNASLTLTDHQVTLTDLVATGFYSNGNSRSAPGSVINISSFNTNISGREDHISGSIRLDNLLQPMLSLLLEADIGAADLFSFADIENINKAKGRVGVEIDYSGRMDDGFVFGAEQILAGSLRGSINLSNVSFYMDKNQLLRYHDFNGFMRFYDNRLTIDRLSGKVGNSDFRFSGFADNLIPYIFLPEQDIYVKTQMHSNKVWLDELLQYNVTSSDTLYRLSLPKHLYLSISASINELDFRRFSAANIQGNAQLNQQVITADEIIFDAMDGNVRMNGFADGRGNNDIWVQTSAKLNGLDINKLFYETGNFGQTNITYDNIHGVVYADLDFAARWDTGLSIDWESMEMTANIKVDNGRMINYHPLTALGRYIRTDNLDSVNFSALENIIHINDRIIHIPMMEVSSNVLNLALSGKHSFDNHIDYKLRVLLSDLMARHHRERRNPQEQYGEIIDDEHERTILFLNLNGTAQNPVFRYDRESHMDHLRNNLAEERQNLRNIMRDEFNFINRQNNDSKHINPDERRLEREQIKKQEESGFIIEWD